MGLKYLLKARLTNHKEVSKIVIPIMYLLEKLQTQVIQMLQHILLAIWMILGFIIGHYRMTKYN